MIILILVLVVAIDLLIAGRNIRERLAWKKRVEECAVRNHEAMREFLRKDEGRIRR